MAKIKPRGFRHADFPTNFDQSPSLFPPPTPNLYPWDFKFRASFPLVFFPQKQQQKRDQNYGTCVFGFGFASLALVKALLQSVLAWCFIFGIL
jgi:hypothetical protein